MRTVVYHDNIHPPVEWLVIAALLWDEIGILDAAVRAVTSGDLPNNMTADILTLQKMVNNGNQTIVRAISLDKAVSRPEYRDAMLRAVRMVDEGKPPRSELTTDEAAKAEAERVGTIAFHQACAEDLATGAQYDVFTEGRIPIAEVFKSMMPKPTDISAHQIVYPGLQALLPVDPSKVDISQILDFRAANELRRLQFLDQSAALIKQFGEISSEQDLDRAVRLYEDAARKELEAVERQYKNVKIDAAFKAMSAFTAMIGPTMAIDSLLHVAIMNPFSVVPGLVVAAGTMLRAKEDAIATINKSPWVYVRDAKKIVGS